MEKTFGFSKEIIKVYIKLKENKTYEVASQLLRSGTSVGANVEEAQAALTKKEFIAKISVAAKEAREARYWLRLIDETGLTAADVKSLLETNKEIINILTKIIKTSQKNFQL